MKRVDGILIVLVVLLALVVLVWAFFSITAPQVGLSPSTESRVSIGQTHGLEASLVLEGGIDFGNVDVPTSDVPAVGNGNEILPSPTQYHINRSSSSNVDIIACVFANAPLTLDPDGTDTIPLIGETFLNASASSSNTNFPGGVPQISFSDATFIQTSGIMTETVPFTLLRFHLDIPGPTLPLAGSYNNTITYASLPVGQDCATIPLP